jgi:hypothetical protein
MTDAITDPTTWIRTVAVQIPTCTTTISSNPTGATVTYRTNQGTGGTTTTPVNGSSVLTIGAIPGDKLTFTVSKSNYKSETFGPYTIKAGSNDFNVLLDPAFTNVRIRGDQNSPSTEIKYTIYNPETYITGDYITIGVIPSLPGQYVELPNIPTGVIMTFYRVGYVGILGTVVVTTDLANNPYVLNFTVISSVLDVIITSDSPIASTAYFIRVKVKDMCANTDCSVTILPAGFFATAGNITSTSGRVWANFRRGSNLVMRFEYIRAIDSVILNTMDVDLGVPTSTLNLVLGKDIMFELPVTIKTIPTGASVYTYPSINTGGNWLGDTPITTHGGWGEYLDLRYELTGYEVLRKKYTLSPGATDIIETLEPFPVYVTVRSNPAGATFRVVNPDGSLGTPFITPGTLILPYNSLLELQFIKTGYNTLNKTYLVKTGLTINENLVLSPVAISFNLVSVPPDSIIYQESPSGSGTYVTIGAAPQSYSAAPARWGEVQKFKFVRAGYYDLIASVTLAESLSGTTIINTMTLLPAPADVRLTTVSWGQSSYTQPASATVTFQAKNFSTGTASVIKTVWLMIGGTHVQSVDIPAIGIGATISRSFTVNTSTVSVGTATACVQFADGTTGTGTPTCGTSTIYAPPVADVRIEDVAWPVASYEKGAQARFYVSVKNYSATTTSIAGRVVWLQLNGVTAQSWTLSAGLAPLETRVNIFYVETSDRPAGTLTGCAIFSTGGTSTT